MTRPQPPAAGPIMSLRTAAGWARGVAELPAGELARLLDEPAAVVWQNLERPVKIDVASLVVQAELPLRDGPVRVAFKRDRPRNWWKALCRQFRSGRAWRAWHAGQRLLALGIATPRPLAVCQPCRPRFFRTSYLATQWLESAENLHLWGWQLARCPPAERHRQAAACAASLGRLVGRLHAAGLAHGDLKAANVLVQDQAGQVATYLIDVEGIRPSRGPGMADLARLAMSMAAHPWLPRTIYRRFLRAYAGEFPPGTIAWKPLWRLVAAMARRKSDEKRRRGQEVL